MGCSDAQTSRMPSSEVEAGIFVFCLVIMDSTETEPACLCVPTTPSYGVQWCVDFMDAAFAVRFFVVVPSHE